MRQQLLTKFDFASGATTSTVSGSSVYMNTEGFAFGGFYCPAEFNGDTITFKSLVDSTAYTKLTKTAATGWNFFTADELVQISSSGTISITTNNATGGAASIWLELKS
jgi:hypothetical protein